MIKFERQVSNNGLKKSCLRHVVGDASIEQKLTLPNWLEGWQTGYCSFDTPKYLVNQFSITHQHINGSAPYKHIKNCSNVSTFIIQSFNACGRASKKED